MKSMETQPDLGKVISWLREELNREFEGENLSGWLIGSILSCESKPEDCDVVLFFDRRLIDRVITSSEILREGFLLTFGIPLHLTRVTFEELVEALFFLKPAFQKPHVLLIPNKRN